MAPRSAHASVASEQAILEAAAASDDIPDCVRKRVRIILRAAEGAPNNRIAQDLSITRASVVRWRGRFLAQGIRGLWNLERVPPRERIPEAVEQAIVFDCLYRPRLLMLPPWDDEPGIRWNVRNLAVHYRISRASVGRILKKHGIQMARQIGIHLEKLKLSPDPLFVVTVCQIGGLLYATLGPALAFCCSARPFSELGFSSLSAAGRNKLADGLVSEFHKLEKRRHDSFYAKLHKQEVRDSAVDRLAKFAAALATQHPEAQIHLLLADHVLNPYDYPSVAKWLACYPRMQMHYAPIATPNGQHWNEFAEHWLKVIAAWPMQATMAESLRRMPRFFRHIQLTNWISL